MDGAGMAIGIALCAAGFGVMLATGRWPGWGRALRWSVGLAGALLLFVGVVSVVLGALGTNLLAILNPPLAVSLDDGLKYPRLTIRLVPPPPGYLTQLEDNEVFTAYQLMEEPDPQRRVSIGRAGDGKGGWHDVTQDVRALIRRTPGFADGWVLTFQDGAGLHVGYEFIDVHSADDWRVIRVDPGVRLGPP
jgi:hypothetical protein